MLKQDTLKPTDLVVAIALASTNRTQVVTFSHLGSALGLSPSTVFEAVGRLQAAGLVRTGTREPNRLALRAFLKHGARYTFPPAIGRVMRGVPTAHSGPPLRALFDDDQPMVWPDIDGPVLGTALAPLYPKAIHLPERFPEVYDALTLVDALRVGQARERKAALQALHVILTASSSTQARS